MLMSFRGASSEKLRKFYFYEIFFCQTKLTTIVINNVLNSDLAPSVCFKNICWEHVSTVTGTVSGEKGLRNADQLEGIKKLLCRFNHHKIMKRKSWSGSKIY